MLRTLATFTALMVVASAGATGTASHYLWSSGTLPDSGEDYYTFRLQIDIWNDDDWTACGLELDLDGGVFYQDPLGANPASPALFPFFPDLEYDTYYTSPSDYPNTDWDGGVVGIASTHDTDVLLDTDWFDTVNSGDGSYVVAQITVLPSQPDWSGYGHLLYAVRSTGGEIFQYDFVLTPEPGALALLALGGLVMLRGQR